jgi:hypothetical protein
MDSYVVRKHKNRAFPASFQKCPVVWYFTPIRALIILWLVFKVTNLSYEVAEINYNERAFGYYFSNYQIEHGVLNKKSK